MMSMVTSLLAAKSGGVQMQVAATIMSRMRTRRNSRPRPCWAGRVVVGNVGAGVGRQSRYFGLKSVVYAVSSRKPRSTSRNALDAGRRPDHEVECGRAEKFAVQTLLGAGASSLANGGAGRRRQSRYFALNPLLPSLRCVAKIAAESYRPERPHDMSKTGTTRVTVNLVIHRLGATPIGHGSMP